MIIDTHSHCYWETLEPRMEEVIENMKKNNVVKAVQIGCDIESSKKALALARRYPTFFLPTIGYHPEHAQYVTWAHVEGELDVLESMIREQRESVVAIGET